MDEQAEREWMTKKEAADYLRVSERTVDIWTGEGKLVKYQIEGKNSVRFKRDDVRALVQPAASGAR